MATSKAVSRSRKVAVRKGPAKSSRPARKAGKRLRRNRLISPSISDWFKSALGYDAYTQSKWAELKDRAWVDNDGMACLVAVEKGEMERGAKALDKLTWERLMALRQSLVQRPAVDVDELMLSDLDDIDPEVVIAAAALKTLSAYMAERFPEREKALQNLKRTEC